MKIYRTDKGGPTPTEAECEEFGHPNLDANGDVMYTNTCFLSLDEAWERLLSSRDASERLALDNVIDQQNRLNDRKEHALQCALNNHAAKEAFDDYQRSREADEK